MTHPLLSMTGFGRGEAAGARATVQAEVRSVNARHLKVSVRAPGDVEGVVPAIEALVRARVARGTVNVHVHLDRTAAGPGMRIDEEALRGYAEAALRALPLDSRARLDAGALLRLPGVLVETTDDDANDEAPALIESAVRAALDGLLDMRAREGEALAGVLIGLLDDVESRANAIGERVPDALAEHRARLAERIAALLDDSDVPDELVARESAVLAERSDVAEELDRLTSHLAQARAAMSADGERGRRLEFLAQEMGREANTIASKSGDQDIRTHALEMRLVVDRLKEQAANVE